jgi:hypothetical protein
MNQLVPNPARKAVLVITATTTAMANIFSSPRIAFPS